MLHVENIEILDTYDREMKIAKKPVDTQESSKNKN